MEADLHNLFPARSGTNRARSTRPFGQVENELREFGLGCDFEIDTEADLVEPPAEARGVVARATFYMHQEYRLPIEPGMLAALKIWNSENPQARGSGGATVPSRHCKARRTPSSTSRGSPTAVTASGAIPR
jgi:endonuclease I